MDRCDRGALNRSISYERLSRPRGREESPRKRSKRKRHRPQEVVVKLRQADAALAKGTPIAEVARSLGVSEETLRRWRAEYGAAAPGDRARDDGDGRLRAARLPCRWPAPEHAAPHGAAEPAPGPALPHGLAAEGALVGRCEQVTCFHGVSLEWPGRYPVFEKARSRRLDHARLRT